MIEALIGLLLGSVITWLCSWYYYKKAGKELEAVAIDLKAEAAKLQRYNTMILNIMEDNGWAKLRRDELNEIAGRIVDSQAKLQAQSSVNIDKTVIRTAKPDAIPK